MKKRKLSEKELYIERYPNAYLVLKKYPLKEFKINTRIEIYLEQANETSSQTYLCLYVDDEFICNSIKLNAPIEAQDINLIVNDFYEEFLSMCNVEDFQTLKKGKCPYNNENAIALKDGQYCTKCPNYSEKPESINNGCYGIFYSYPKHVNFWKTERKWAEKYGSGTKAEKNFYEKCLTDAIHTYMLRTSRSKNAKIALIKKIIKIVKEG